ncbi:hypothetical protein [Nocardioides aequoreus]|uniref:hypothetical protein n=1 Tax=Nocardioides aequoreus TaxID=397278 RepID=UPI0004C37CA3|nr:hypothetical protein [Nocardioides aequoreus]
MSDPLSLTWLRIAGWVGLVVAAAGVVGGAAAIVVDLARTDDEMHGLGVLLGGVVVLLACVPGALAVAVLRLRERRPQGVSLLAVLLGVVLCVFAPAVVGFFVPVLSVPALLLGLLVLGLGVAASVRLRRAPSGSGPVGDRR